MRPCARNPPFCTREELRDGTYSLDDLADFHEWMDLEYENLRRYNAALEKEREGK